MWRKREYKISLEGDRINFRKEGLANLSRAGEVYLGNNKSGQISVEETLLDSSSEYQNLEIPISNSVFKIILLFIIVFSIIILVFVFNFSVIKHDYFANISYQNRTINFFVPPPRGVIFDRLGKPLVKNKPVFNLIVVSRIATDLDNILNREDILNKIADILNKDRDEFRKFIFDEVKKNSIFFVDSDLDKEEVLKIKTLNLKGFYLILSNKRQYIDGPQFSQIIGYVGKVSKKELDADSYYYPTDTIGRLGIESWYEKYLRGTHGEIFFQSDKDYLIKDPEIGNSIILNIDYNIQKALFNELFNILKESGHSKAAAIVQNPQTGEVLAMVSFPTYDNNLFIEGLSEIQFKNLFENKLKPIFNRVISGLYNPGSTIKPLMGLMTLQENIFNPTDTIRDCVNLVIKNQNNPDNFYTFNNWRPEYGLFNLKRSIANSCNIYFFIAGGGYGNIKGLGIEKIANYLKSLFVDTKLGIDLPGESSGLIPTPEWKLKNRNEPWYQGDTYNVSIGQGDLLVTPLWLNSYISAIANGGIFYKPFIVKQVLNKNKEVLKTFDSEILGHLNFRDEFIKEVRDAMLETTLTGTAKLLGTLPVKVGAKTGTAEVIKGRSVNSIITAFAPFENPEINITVLIEGEASINQGLALRTAYGFLKWYFEEYSNYNRSE